MRFFDHIDRGAIGKMLERDEYFWLDLTIPARRRSPTLEDLFHFHPLALEDTRKGQRPKLEDFGTYMFLVYYGAVEAERGGGELIEVHAFLSGGYLVTIHDGDCAALDEVRKRLDRQAPRSEQFVVYRVLDALTDTFFPLLERTSKTGSNGSTRRSSHDPSPRPARAAHRTAPGPGRARRVATPQRDMLARHIDDILEIPGLQADSRNYFRDVYDHAIRISDQIDSYRDLLIGSSRRLSLGHLQPPQRNHQATDRDRDDLPAALLHRRLLRPELRLDGGNIQHRGVLLADRRWQHVGRWRCWSGFAAPPTSESAAPLETRERCCGDLRNGR